MPAPGTRAVLAQDLQEPGVGGVHDLADRLEDPLLGDGIVGRRRQGGGVLGVEGQDPFDLGHAAIDHQRRGGDAGGHPFTRHLRVGVQVRTEGPQPRVEPIEPLGRVRAL